MPMLGVQGNNVVLARNLVPADDGPHNYMVFAMQNGVTIQGTFTINITPTPIPASIAVAPDPSSIPDNSTIGTQVSTVTVTTSDNSPFTGSLSVSGPA